MINNEIIIINNKLDRNQNCGKNFLPVINCSNNSYNVSNLLNLDLPQHKNSKLFIVKVIKGQNKYGIYNLSNLKTILFVFFLLIIGNIK